MLLWLGISSVDVAFISCIGSDTSLLKAVVFAISGAPIVFSCLLELDCDNISASGYKRLSCPCFT